MNGCEVEYDKLIRETDAAQLYSIGGDEVWIPKSVILDDDGTVLTVQRWFAEKEGLT